MKLTKSNSILFVFLLLNVFMFSCKKEIEDIPDVSFIKPTEDKHFTIGDTIEIVFEVQSISKISSIEVGIVDDKLIPVSKTYMVNQLNGKTSGVIHFAIFLTDIFLDPGKYQVMAKVSNEVETKHKYRWINLASPTRKFMGVAVITKSSSKVKVWNYDLNFNKTLKKQMSGDYGGSVYMPFHNRMALSSKLQGSYTIWDYFSGDTIYNQPGLGVPPFPYFTGTNRVDNNLTVQYYGGAFSLLNHNGSMVMNINTTSGFYPQRIFDVGDNFVSIEYSRSSMQKLLVVHYGSTGMKYGTIQLKNGPVVGAFPFENNDFMYFCNYLGNGHIVKYSWNDNNTNELGFYYNGSEFIDATKKGPKEYLMLTSKAVLWYDYSRSHAPAIVKLSVSDPIKVLYEELSGTIWVVDKHGFSSYSFPTGNLISDQRINEEVLNMHLIYNR